MIKLNKLLQCCSDASLPEKLSLQTVSCLVNDSRQLVSGCVFLAARGLSSHALDHLTAEQYQTAAAIVYEPDYDISRFTGNTANKGKFIAVADLHRHIGTIARQFYNPRHKPQFSAPLIGVTGTNGKTSMSQFIAQLADYACIGTMGYGRPNHLAELAHTTPDALQMQKILAELSSQVSGVAMEVSSHALVLHRVDAVAFDIAVFTNLSQDHLDFHADIEDYFQAKAKLFQRDSVKTAIINTDDEHGFRLAMHCQAEGKRVIAFGKNSRCQRFIDNVHIESINLSQRGISADLSLHFNDITTSQTLLAPIWGSFNVYNIIAALLALQASGKDINTLLKQVQHLQGVKGRIEHIDLGEDKTAIIDYAHTPDALQNTLLSLREHMRAHTEKHFMPPGKIYTVFGCGGDRDKAKRPLMAEAVNTYSDFGIITDDNPRTEKSQAIIEDMLAGDIERIRFQIIPSRRAAILFGLTRLQRNDVLLIAGKGHEDYQIIGTEKTPFSDHDIVTGWLS